MRLRLGRHPEVCKALCLTDSAKRRRARAALFLVKVCCLLDVSLPLYACDLICAAAGAITDWGKKGCRNCSLSGKRQPAVWNGAGEVAVRRSVEWTAEERRHSENERCNLQIACTCPCSELVFETSRVKKQLQFGEVGRGAEGEIGSRFSSRGLREAPKNR